MLALETDAVNAAEPEKLYHYTTAEDALTLVSTGNFKWLSPADFNGTTELNRESTLTFDRDSLTESCVKMASNLIFGRDNPEGDTPLIGAIRRWRESQRFASHEEAEVVLHDLLNKMVSHRIEELHSVIDDWKSYCDQTYLISLFERPDNFLAWDKHAEAFKGAVFRFKVGSSTPFPNPKPVAYHNIHPEIASLKDQYAAIFYNMNTKANTNFEEKFLCKAPPFKHEKEWRCFSQSSNGNIDSIKSALTGLYLGPNIPTELKEQIVSQCHTHFPKAKVAQMHFVKGKFDLSVETMG